MDKALFIAMTGAMHNIRSQAARANNLANANTTGFKADFEQARAMPVFGVVHPSRAYSLSERPATDIRDGHYNHTGNALDVAIRGEGWIAVQARDGSEAYTRRGDLQVDETGILRTGNGLAVMGNGGPVSLPQTRNITVGMDGSISVAGDGNGELVAVVDRIKLVNPAAQGLFMDKGTDGLMRVRNNPNQVLEADGRVELETQTLETSNVSAVAELTAVLSLARQYEMSTKMMKTIDQNASKSTSMLRST